MSSIRTEVLQRASTAPQPGETELALFHRAAVALDLPLEPGDVRGGTVDGAPMWQWLDAMTMD